MSDAQVAAPAAGKKTVNLDLVKILNLGCNILHQAFVVAKENEAKTRLKELKSGKAIKVGALTLTPKPREGSDVAVPPPIEMPLRLALDYSEFVGPFNFPDFRQALAAMLQRIGRTMKDKGDLNILTNPHNNSALVHQPGVINTNGQFNVLVLTIEPGSNKEIVLKLMFVDPNQYEQLRPAQV
jgi:hypothetical protein